MARPLCLIQPRRSSCFSNRQVCSTLRPANAASSPSFSKLLPELLSNNRSRTRKFRERRRWRANFRNRSSGLSCLKPLGM